jgi:hypothetical protein
LERCSTCNAASSLPWSRLLCPSLNPPRRSPNRHVRTFGGVHSAVDQATLRVEHRVTIRGGKLGAVSRRLAKALAGPPPEPL